MHIQLVRRPVYGKLKVYIWKFPSIVHSTTTEAYTQILVHIAIFMWLVGRECGLTAYPWDMLYSCCCDRVMYIIWSGCKIPHVWRSCVVDQHPGINHVCEIIAFKRKSHFLSNVSWYVTQLTLWSWRQLAKIPRHSWGDWREIHNFLQISPTRLANHGRFGSCTGWRLLPDGHGALEATCRQDYQEADSTRCKVVESCCQKVLFRPL